MKRGRIFTQRRGEDKKFRHRVIFRVPGSGVRVQDLGSHYKLGIIDFRWKRFYQEVKKNTPVGTGPTRQEEKNGHKKLKIILDRMTGWS